MKVKVLSLLLVLLSVSCAPKVADPNIPVEGRWSKERINEWYNKLPWLVGCNYYPSTAINQIDMWQESTWDPTQIEKELDWAAELGMNTLRVYLHDLVWGDDEQGLYKRMDQFLGMSDKRGIKPWFVFFDDCHFPNPQLGEQPLPVKRYHNSGWVNCPGRDLAERYAAGTATKEECAHLKGYVQKTIKHFANDERILLWELYNEPGRGNGDNGDMATTQADNFIGDNSAKLVYDAWVWAREINPSQPLIANTTGCVGQKNMHINHINTDIFSIHPYTNAEKLRSEILRHQKEGRPVLVTEWLARNIGSTVEDCLPVMKELNAGAIQWGFVSGETATIWPWKSRTNPDGTTARNITQERLDGNVVRPSEEFPEPKVWFHDLYRMNGEPYCKKEIEIFKELTKDNKKF